MDDVFIRGNVVEFETTFYDAAGSPVAPASATLILRTAPLNLPPQTITINMTGAGTVWTAEWETTDVPPGIVYWAVQATNPSAAGEGNFYLEANAANAEV